MPDGKTTDLYYARLVRGGQSVDAFDLLRPTCSLTYDGNGNTGGSVPVDNTQYGLLNQVTVLGNTGNLVRGGFRFGGWNTEPDGTGASYLPSAKFYIQSAFITGLVNMLYAQWGTGTVAGGCTLDVDGNGGPPDALTDGLLLLRAMFGLTGTAVTNGAIGGGTPTRSTWGLIQPYLNTNCGGNFAP